MVKLSIPKRLIDKGTERLARRQRAFAAMQSNPKLQISCCSDDVAVAALAYTQRGWAVLPLYSTQDGACTCAKGDSCKSPGKHPILAGGVHGATSDEDEVARLWREYPGANIGIATGRASGLVALDVDPRNGGRETMKLLAGTIGPVPPTVYAHTGGGGSHRLFCYPGGPLPTRHAPAGLSGVDVQSDGAYIVAPPSRHASGQCYRWREGRDPASLSLAALPDAWLMRLAAPETPPSPPPRLSLGDTIGEGGRNTHLTSRAGALRQAGLSAEAILAALKVVNSERCTPPLDEDEVARIAASVGRYPAAPSSTGDEAEGVMQTVLDQHYASGAHLLRPSDGQFWAFDGTRWAPLGGKVLSGIALAAIQAVPGRRGQNTASLMQQVIRLIEARVAADGDPLRFSAPPLPVINCRNGELWIAPDGSLDLRPHNPASYLRHRLDVNYDSGAACPRYDEAVLQIFGKTPDPAAMVGFWHELMGYALQPDRRVPLVLLGWGAGNNGKTRLLETYTHLVGRDLVVAMPIGDIDKSRFSTGNLLGKLALIDDDVRAGTRLPDGQLKRLSEEKTVTGEHKFGPPFTFTVRTAIVMLFNNPPSLADLSHGMQRRLFVVPFDRSFTPEETDPGLFKAIWVDELPGVLNRYLAGLQRFIRRGWTFAPPEASVKAKASLLQAANPVPAFVEERCERTGSAYVQELYTAYTEWARQAGITIVPQRLSFQRSLESLGFTVKHGNQGTKLFGLRLRGAPAPAWPRRPQP